jgi:RimJ/RimL family protein N-acetyltransferase
MSRQESLFCGKLLRLAAPRAEDAEIVASWSNDADYLRQVDTDFARPRTTQETTEEINSRRSGNTCIEFHLRTVLDDRLIGFVAIHSIEWNNQIGTISIGIGESEFRGKGYGSEALRLMLNYAFNELNLYRVGLDVIASNTRAIHAYEKAGFISEGLMRSAVMRDGVRGDLLIMGILRTEWVG